MISAETRADVRKESLSLDAGYAKVDRLLRELESIAPELTNWHGGITTPDQDYVNFRDKTTMLERVQARIDAFKAQFPALPNADGFGLRLSSNSEKKRRPGLFELAYEPARGVVALDIHQPDVAFEERATTVVARALAAIAKLEDVQYAFVDVRDRVPDRPRPTTYRLSYATFPHRKAVGWMNFVPSAVTADQLPTAAELVPVPGKGTVIVAVGEAFSLTNKTHIKQANIVEMELADLDLLPVVDPSLR
ncbi:immunity 52 family protein [Luteimonas sp. SJ-92]|uniref:Immunity 52 family protein n=1 Tax=Luteimonas salinisoli TaxID=2752307 RepID=A0A853J890_9GAMM|nr:Imm52 family immunity protein [Luteimonas salinisoli]NZA24919.1 immunity 52 family protein [Luteimonas salinisoli]